MNAMSKTRYSYVDKNPTRHGKIRYYLRRYGRRIRLPDDIDSEEFAVAYWKARNAVEKERGSVDGPDRVLAAVKQNTFRWLCVLYLSSSDYLRLDDSTRAKRRAIIDSMCLEPLTLREGDKRLIADVPLPLFNAGHVEGLRDRKLKTPFAADERLKVLRQILDTRGPDGKPIVHNVARTVKPFRKQTEGHHTITPSEIERFIQHHGERSKAVLAMALMMFTGFRVSDLAVIGPQHRRGDVFHLRLFKNRNRTPVDVVMPLHPILGAVLASYPVKGMTYMQTEHGKAYSVKGLGNRISDWFDQAGLPHCTAHSVRKGLATDQAHNGATDLMLEAMFGWKDGKTSKIYTRNAEQARLARHAIDTIAWDGIGAKLLALGGER